MVSPDSILTETKFKLPKSGSELLKHIKPLLSIRTISYRTIGELRPGLLTISQLTLDLRITSTSSQFPTFHFHNPFNYLFFVPKSETFQPLLISPIQNFPSQPNIDSRRSCSCRTSFPLTVSPRTIYNNLSLFVFFMCPTRFVTPS